MAAPPPGPSLKHGRDDQSSEESKIDDLERIITMIANVFYPQGMDDSNPVESDPKRTRAATTAASVDSESKSTDHPLGQRGIYANAYERDTGRIVAGYLPRTFTIWVANVCENLSSYPYHGPSANDRLWDALQQPFRSVMPITIDISDRGGVDVQCFADVMFPTRDMIDGSSWSDEVPFSPTTRMHRVRAPVEMELNAPRDFYGFSCLNRRRSLYNEPDLGMFCFQHEPRPDDNPDKVAALRQFCNSRQMFDMWMYPETAPSRVELRYKHALLLDSGDWDRISHLAEIGYLLPTPEELARNTSTWRRYCAYRAELGARFRRLEAEEAAAHIRHFQGEDEGDADDLEPVVVLEDDE
jgi:hypothetical protein